MNYVKFQCPHCGRESEKTVGYFNWNKRRGIRSFCSKECNFASRNKEKEVSCAQCFKLFNKKSREIETTNNNFCSRSCAATYNNTHKTTGTRRSKLEIYLEQELPKIYPSLDFLFNDKTTINSELDIYIPSLKLAFELNGIFHYEPIYGQDKLDQIQNNDGRKYQACLENNIELCIIDSSGLKYFKPEKAIFYLNIISNIIKSRMD